MIYLIADGMCSPETETHFVFFSAKKFLLKKSEQNILNWSILNFQRSIMYVKWHPIFNTYNYLVLKIIFQNISKIYTYIILS